MDRGVDAMAKTLRKPLPEDVDFMHASREEMKNLRQAIYPLTRKLAVRLARKRRHGRKGPLDFRSTMRHSLSYGGVPAEPKFRYLPPAKPEIFVIADISGSVAAFARFTLHLVYAISNQFSKVRSFVFIDGIDEVTSYFEGVEDIGAAVHRVNTEADVVWVDGHSDYGHALELFFQKWGKDIGPKTTVMILGDARNNYHASQSWVIKEMRHKARHVFWLNPEPRSYWDTGDSIVGEYGIHCDGVFECRNLRQLEVRRQPRVRVPGAAGGDRPSGYGPMVIGRRISSGPVPTTRSAGPAGAAGRSTAALNRLRCAPRATFAGVVPEASGTPAASTRHGTSVSDGAALPLARNERSGGAPGAGDSSRIVGVRSPRSSRESGGTPVAPLVSPSIRNRTLSTPGSWVSVKTTWPTWGRVLAVSKARLKSTIAVVPSMRAPRSST
ncbi:MAG: VWA domain-containing protein [Acidimicrobiales bacterium]